MSHPQSEAELLNNRIAEIYRERDRQHHNTELIRRMAAVAIPAVLRAAAGGNVHCIEAANRCIILIKKLQH